MITEEQTETATETPTETVASEATEMEAMFKRELGIESAPKDESGNSPDKALSEGHPKESAKTPEELVAETPAEQDVEPS